MGNTLTIGGKAREYLYDTSGRMTQVKRAGAAVMNYRYNGRCEQVLRYLGTTNTHTLYNQAATVSATTKLLADSNCMRWPE
ncbi:vacuolar-type H+-ATPase subunit E/Vma4 [Xanthomonas campestris]|nr:vacuolar-type H+-ATPase subunit E/Vma4 [Xanthomonas sp. 3075]